MNLTDVQVDPKAIESGEWVDDLPGGDGIRIRTRGITSKVFEAKRDLKVRKLPRSERNGPGGMIPTETMNRITAEVLLEDCLLEWDGLFEFEGGPKVEYSKEKARELLLNPAYRPLYDICFVAATMVGQRRTAAVDDAVKNS